MAEEFRVTTDHDTIKQWVEARGGRPAKLKESRDATLKALRIMFPGEPVQEPLEEITWEEFFSDMEKKDLALLERQGLGNVQLGQDSSPQLISREAIAQDAVSHRLGEGAEIPLPSAPAMPDRTRPAGLPARQGEESQSVQIETLLYENEKVVGNYLVGYAVKQAEGTYILRNGRLQWQPPNGENVHLEVSVRDRESGRFIPGLTVHATLVDEQGQEIGTHRHFFLWHPGLYHYGRNWRILQGGQYTLRVLVKPPSFAGPRASDLGDIRTPLQIQFNEVQINTT